MSGQPTPGDLKRAAEWYEAAFAGPAEGLPFSFTFGGAESASLLPSWAPKRTDETVSKGVATRTVSLQDPKTGLVCSCEVKRFEGFPAVEWLLRFTNEGSADTPILSDIRSLDATLGLDGNHFRVHGANGSLYNADDFAPNETVIKDGGNHHMGPSGGRSSSGALPFFNLDAGSHGVIGAIGWTGNWDADFRTADGKRARVRAGLRGVHTKLLPGESIRTARILLVFWEGDRLHGHNMLRRVILRHYSPDLGESSRIGAPEPPLSIATWGENEAGRQVAKINWLAENDIPVDNYWIDAGWHGDVVKTEKATVFNTQWWAHVGNWRPNRPNYPEGLGAIGKLAAEKGMRFTLWFETERAYKDTDIVREHPEWLFSLPEADSYLVNLGDPAARQGITDLISSVLSENNVTLYRQDFNMEPEPYWKAADAPDRQGMSEIRHIEGLYAFWDELLRRHPGLIIDNCASGGRRIDLETISRSIPLWRSDYQCYPHFDPIGMQSQTHGLSLWVPLSTGACDHADTYAFRSAILPGIVLCTVVAGPDEPEGFRTPWDAFPVEWMKRMTEEQRAVKQYASGDFYPLVSFALGEDLWAVWQFDRPDLGEGALVALRRQKCPFPTVEPRLQGLEEDAKYELYSFDDDTAQMFSGKDLMDGKLSIAIADTPGSRLYRYRRL